MAAQNGDLLARGRIPQPHSAPSGQGGGRISHAGEPREIAARGQEDLPSGSLTSRPRDTQGGGGGTAQDEQR